jgi:hypothetical protein
MRLEIKGIETVRMKGGTFRKRHGENVGRNGRKAISGHFKSEELTKK